MLNAECLQRAHRMSSVQKAYFVFNGTYEAVVLIVCGILQLQFFRAFLLTYTFQALTMSATSQRRAYAGTARKLVLAFDVGTTFSGISYWYGHLPHTPSVLILTSRLFSAQHPGPWRNT